MNPIFTLFEAVQFFLQLGSARNSINAGHRGIHPGSMDVEKCRMDTLICRVADKFDAGAQGGREKASGGREEEKSRGWRQAEPSETSDENIPGN
ncbi:hypothetical protein KM043_009893 [Ampulex compressa]|nr:hypothetical protein KM043_009893 [Ampulex compressa]